MKLVTSKKMEHYEALQDKVPKLLADLKKVKAVKPAKSKTVYLQRKTFNIESEELRFLMEVIKNERLEQMQRTSESGVLLRLAAEIKGIDSLGEYMDAIVITEKQQRETKEFDVAKV